MGQSSLMGDSSFMWMQQSHVGQSISRGTEQFLMEQGSLIWDRSVCMLWDIAVLCWTDHSHVGQITFLWDRAVSCETEKSNGGKSSFL